MYEIHIKIKDLTQSISHNQDWLFLPWKLKVAYNLWISSTKICLILTFIFYQNVVLCCIFKDFKLFKSLLQIVLFVAVLVAKSCQTLLQPHELQPTRLLCPQIFQARILLWVVISSSRESSWPRDQIPVSCIGRQILYHWATREVHFYKYKLLILLLDVMFKLFNSLFSQNKISIRTVFLNRH